MLLDYVNILGTVEEDLLIEDLEILKTIGDYIRKIKILFIYSFI